MSFDNTIGLITFKRLIRKIDQLELGFVSLFDYYKILILNELNCHVIIKFEGNKE